MSLLICLLSLNIFLAGNNTYIFLESKESPYYNYNYLIDDKSFILRLYRERDGKTENQIYLFENNMFNKSFCDYTLFINVISQFRDRNNMLNNKYKDILKEKYRRTIFIDIENEKYIVCIFYGEEYGDQYLGFFDGKKIDKIDIGEIMPNVFLGGDTMYYEKETKILYFTAEKMIEAKDKKRTFNDYGIYAYSIEKRKIKLFLKRVNDNNITYRNPFRIPNTNKIITASTTPKHVEFIVKDMLINID